MFVYPFFTPYTYCFITRKSFRYVIYKFRPNLVSETTSLTNRFTNLSIICPKTRFHLAKTIDLIAGNRPWNQGLQTHHLSEISGFSKDTMELYVVFLPAKCMRQCSVPVPVTRLRLGHRCGLYEPNCSTESGEIYAFDFDAVQRDYVGNCFGFLGFKFRSFLYFYSRNSVEIRPFWSVEFFNIKFILMCF